MSHKTYHFILEWAYNSRVYWCILFSLQCLLHQVTLFMILMHDDRPGQSKWTTGRDNCTQNCVAPLHAVTFDLFT